MCYSEGIDFQQRFLFLQFDKWSLHQSNFYKHYAMSDYLQNQWIDSTWRKEWPQMVYRYYSFLLFMQILEIRKIIIW